mmetsp:Transcript_7423/g.10962  ORF Transcript_7423/g.10962 Transcript_7423/m.10962 type:complete len:202 (+) Transcript_7423:274-879(+)
MYQHKKLVYPQRPIVRSIYLNMIAQRLFLFLFLFLHLHLHLHLLPSFPLGLRPHPRLLPQRLHPVFHLVLLKTQVQTRLRLRNHHFHSNPQRHQHLWMLLRNQPLHLADLLQIQLPHLHPQQQSHQEQEQPLLLAPPRLLLQHRLLAQGQGLHLDHPHQRQHLLRQHREQGLPLAPLPQHRLQRRAQDLPLDPHRHQYQRL